MTPISAQSSVAQLMPPLANGSVLQAKAKIHHAGRDVATTALLISQVINYLIAVGPAIFSTITTETLPAIVVYLLNFS